MKVWVVKLYEECYGYEISNVYSSFEKAKDSVRAYVQEFVSQFDKETVTDIMNNFEKKGWIDDFIRISEYEVD